MKEENINKTNYCNTSDAFPYLNNVAAVNVLCKKYHELMVTGMDFVIWLGL